MTNLNYGVCDCSCSNSNGRENNYESITNTFESPEFIQGDNREVSGLTQAIGTIGVDSSNLKVENRGKLCEIYKDIEEGNSKSLNVANFVCEKLKKDGIIKNANNGNKTSQFVGEREEMSLLDKTSVGGGRAMTENLEFIENAKKNLAVGEADGVPRRPETENLSVVEQMNLLIQAENAKKLSKNAKISTEDAENIQKNTEVEPEKDSQNDEKIDGVYVENVIKFPSNSRASCENDGEGGGKIDDGGLDDLKKIIDEAGGEAEIISRLQATQNEAIEQMKSQNVIVGEQEGMAVVDPKGFENLVQIDSAEVDRLFQSIRKTYKCELLNMDLQRSNVKNWETINWVKFFLKSVKSVSFTLRYFDRLFDRQVRASFYSEHIAKFGSIENFFESLAELIERKRRMSELKSFAKRLYKELSDLEILIVDKLVFGADNVAEITKEISLRTMYRKADKILPKLVEFMEARGYTPNWCYKKFGSLVR